MAGRGRSKTYGFTSFMKDVSKAVDSGVDLLENAGANVGQHKPVGVMSLFATGNVVQLLPFATASKRTTLQIVVGQQGRLEVNGLGPAAPNAHWTVINDGHNKIRLHNQNNFIAVANNNLCLVNMASGATAGVETLFYLSQNMQYIQLTSVANAGCHLAVDTTGKAMCKTNQLSFKNFGVQLVYSPYGQGPSPYAQTVCAPVQPMGASGQPMGAPGQPMGAPGQPIGAPGQPMAGPPPQAPYAHPPQVQPPATFQGAPGYQEKGSGAPPPYQA